MNTRSFFTVLLLITFFCGVVVAQENEDALPDAEYIIAEYVEAIGSEMALRGVQTMTLEAE